MQPRTRKILINIFIAAAVGAYLVVLLVRRPAASLRSPAMEAVPAGAFLVASADVDALRKTPLFARLLGADRDIAGLGKMRDLCGFDPMERVGQLVFVVPAGGEDGEFGVVAAGDVPADELIACTSKVIEKRGGQPVVSTVGSFRTVRDGTLVLSGAETAVRDGGPVLLGAGPYLRAMIDAADGRIATIRTSVAHARLGEQVAGATARLTVVLTPSQREDLAQALAEQGGPRGAASIFGGALGVTVGEKMVVQAIIACESADGCAEVAALLRKARDERAADVATRIAGFAGVLSAIQIEAQGETVRIRAEIPTDEAAVLLDRVLVLRGMRHPMPKASVEPAPQAPPPATAPPGEAPSGAAAPGTAAPSAPGAPADAGAPDAMALPPPDEVLRPGGDAGAPSDAGARDAAH